jgi:hypothetical protein
MRIVGTVIVALLLALACDQETPLRAFPSPGGGAGVNGAAGMGSCGTSGTPPTGVILPPATGGTSGGTFGGVGGSGVICGTGGVVTPPTVDIDQLPCEIADGALGETTAGTPEEDEIACVISPRQNEACPRAGFTCGESPCVCHLCKYRGGELYLNRWVCY